MQWPESVQSGDFIRGLPDNVKTRLAALGEQRHFPDGSVVFQEGALHNTVHLVIGGRVQLDVMVPQRGRIPILALGPGDLLGWSPIFGHTPMTATATALEAVDTLAIPGDALRHLCETDLQVGFAVMRQLALSLSQRLVATRSQLFDIIS